MMSIFSRRDFNLAALKTFYDGKNMLPVILGNSEACISHGKSACDGIGRTVKRLATNARLMATEKNHILMPLDLFDLSSKNICNIDLIYISAEEITEHCQKKI